MLTEEEAEMFLNLSLKLETAGQIAERLGRPEREVSSLLRRMGEKGNLFFWRRGDEVKYGATPYIMGLYEFQMNTLFRPHQYLP